MEISRKIFSSRLFNFKIVRQRRKPLPPEVVEVIHKSVRRATKMSILYVTNFEVSSREGEPTEGT